MQSFIMNSHEVFIHIHQGCFAGTGAIIRLPQCQWSRPDGYGKLSQCKTTTKHSRAKTVCIFLGIYYNSGSFNILRPRQNGRHFTDDIIKCILLNENIGVSIIPPKLVPKGPFSNTAATVQIMAWRRPGGKPLSEPILVILLTYVCVTRPKWGVHRLFSELTTSLKIGYPLIKSVWYPNSL